MRANLVNFSMQKFGALSAGVALLAWSAFPLAHSFAANRVQLTPRFFAGQSLRYRIESRTSTKGKATSPIVDPEGSQRLDQTTTMIVRLDVLDVKADAAGAASRVRMRATYEKSEAVLESDAYDPGAAALQQQYEKMEGRAFQFTIEPGGKVSSITGLEDVMSNPSAARAVENWMDGLASSAKYPRDGIGIGEKWTNDRALENTPLVGLTFHTESAYLRDEQCPSPVVGNDAATAPAVPNAATCAVVLTKYRIERAGGHGDATPESYVHNGLRTSGTWTGSGESLDDVALTSGIVVRSTQTGVQDMDFDVVSATSGSKMSYKGHIDSQTEIALLPPDAATDSSAPSSK
jgi:hypothetical protein